MAKGSSRLANSIVQLLAAGLKELSVINKIKLKSWGKYITVKNIKATISKIKESFTAATLFGSLKPTQQIKSALSRVSRTLSSTARIGFSFQFKFGAGSQSGKSGRQGVFMTLDLPANTTKRQALDNIQEKIQAWIEAHYQSDPEGRKTIRVTVKSVTGV